MDTLSQPIAQLILDVAFAAVCGGSDSADATRSVVIAEEGREAFDVDAFERGSNQPWGTIITAREIPGASWDLFAALDEEAQDEIEDAAVEVARAEEVAQLREWVDDE